MIPIVIRPAEARDAAAVAGMAAEFYAFMNDLSPTNQPLAFDEQTYLRDGFGQDPAFFGIIAERGGEAAGYLLYSFIYDVDHAARVLHISDLYVRKYARHDGVGTALMQAARDAVRQVGGRIVIWEVLDANRAAIAFYKRLGGSFLPKSAYMYWNPAA